MRRPQVTLHFAQSLDGRIGLGPGCERALLSSEQGLSCAHHARATHDAVLVGIETALHDDPQLTARVSQGAQPLRIVLDSALRLPLSARLLAPGAGGPVLVVGTATRASPEQSAALVAAGARVRLLAPSPDGRVALGPLLELLAAEGVDRLLVEGGARVLTSFLRERLADRAQIEIAPLLLGAPATNAIGELGVSSVPQALPLDDLQVERLGSTVLLRGKLSYPGEAGS